MLASLFGFNRKQLPYIAQSQAAECGLACLAMISGYHGQHLSLHELRQRAGISLKGTNLLQMIEMARDIGLGSTAMRVALADLSAVQMPCVLHWNLSHFVVLHRMQRGRALIHDPAKGVRWIDQEELSQSFTGVVLELAPTVDFQPRARAASVSFRRLAGDLTALMPAFAKIFMVSLVLQGILLVLPFHLQWTVDQALVAGDAGLISLLAIGFLCLVLFQVFSSMLRGFSVLQLSSSLGLHWQSSLFSHLLRLPPDFVERRHLGDVVSRLNSVNVIQRTLTNGFIEALVDGVMAILTIALMVIYSPLMAAISTLTLLLYVGLRIAMQVQYRQSTEA